MNVRAIFAPLFFLIPLFFVGLFFSPTVFASETNGTIDPNNQGYYLINFVDAPDVGTTGADSRINAGKFTTQSSANLHITDAGLTGYFWGGTAGWIITNCSTTVSGCSGANANFKVFVSQNGTLSGYAWGENTGWINFGPFSLNTVPQVKIAADGFFRGTLSSDVGYAWSENFGWIMFDCSTTTNCLYTDYVPVDYRSVTPPYSGGVTGMSTQCSNGIDDDGDGYADFQDPQCAGGGSSEFFYAPVFVPGYVEIVDAEVPQIPLPTPTNPSTPSVPKQPTTTIPGIPVTPSETTTEVPQEIIPIVTDTIEDIFSGELSVPEARDRVIAVFLLLIDTIKNFFENISTKLLEFMSTSSVQESVLQIALTGLGIVALFAVLMAVFVPTIESTQILLLPQLVWQNIKTLFGAGAALWPWGIVYNSATRQPLSLTEVAIINEQKEIVKTVVTTTDGTFSAVVPDGVYTLAIGAQGAMVTQSDTPIIFNTSYSDTMPMSINNSVPAEQFDVVVRGTVVAPTYVSPFKEFLLFHEVSLTNISFVLFGMGMMAAILYLIFVPSTMALVIFLGYVGIALLRGIGVFGSYASIFMNKTNEQPLAGMIVTVFDAITNMPVTKALTSRFGRVYLTLSEGYYYSSISSVSNTVPNPISTLSKPFTARPGLFRKRFTV